MSNDSSQPQQPDFSAQLKTGLELHQSGRLNEAATIYQSILQEHPEQADALHLLGVLSLQTGQAEIAVALFERGIKVRPDDAEFFNMCGEACRMLKNYDVAIARYQQALAIEPEFAGVHNNLGNTFVELHRFDDAVACYEKAIAIDPGFPMSHNNLGIVLKELGRAQEAITHHKKAIAIMPAYAEAHSSLGNALQAIGQAEDAIAQHEQAIAINPDYAEAYSNLGNALKESGRSDEAIVSYKKALSLQPDFDMAHYNLGIILDELARPEEAAGYYEQALAINPNYAQAHHNYANVLDELGRREDAIAHYGKALAIKPDYAEAQRNLSRLQPQQGRLAEITQQLSSPAISTADAIHCHFALGNIHHHAKSFDQAFKHFNDGNSLQREAISYDSRNFSAYVDRLIKTYSPSYFRDVAAGGSASELPVFILGMPRSGTSLVEQIVSSHPQVYGAGELATLGDFEKTLAELNAAEPYPECMPNCHTAIGHEFATKYLGELALHSRNAQRITDKMPNNFMRIGLIKTLFPQARIIHCRRNALDTCTSNFLNYFKTGNEYSFNLQDLGKYYLDYDRLMAHWDSLFSSAILSIHYEDLVLQQEKISQQIISYLGLEWDQRCLEFHKNDRAVHNFSSMQVRQPIYSGAINRWQQYEKQLAPLIEILPDAVTNRPTGSGSLH